MKSVFVSHSSSDKAVADMIVESLENEGITAWIAPRDIPAGSDYGASIMRGLRECEVLVLVFSKMSNESDAVIREVQVAFNEKKAMVPFRIENVPVGDSLGFYLSGLHWVDAVQKSQNVDVLLKDVKGILQSLGKEIQQSPPTPVRTRVTVPSYTPAPSYVPVPGHAHAASYAPAPSHVPIPGHVPAPSHAPVPSYAPASSFAPPSHVPVPSNTKPISIMKILIGAACGVVLVAASVYTYLIIDRGYASVVDQQTPTSDVGTQPVPPTLAPTPAHTQAPSPSLMDLVTVSLGERFQTNLATGADGRIAMVMAEVVVGIDGNAEPEELESLIVSFNTRLDLARSVIIHEFGMSSFDEVNSPDGQIALAESMSRALQEQFETDVYIRVFFSDWTIQRGR